MTYVTYSVHIHLLLLPLSPPKSTLTPPNFVSFFKIFLDSPGSDLYCPNTHGCGSVYWSMAHLQDTTPERTSTLHPQKPSAVSSSSARSGGLGAPSLSAGMVAGLMMLKQPQLP